MKLYKYMSEAAGLAFLKEPALRLTPGHCLNDPFECKVTEKSKSALRQLLGEHSSTNAAQDVFMANFENFLNSHGIISLSDNHEELLMWSHYADEHRGIVIEFEVDPNRPFDLFYNQPPESSDSHFSDVSYDKPRVFPKQIAPDNLDEVRAHYYLSKYQKWKYEGEYRYVLPFTMGQFVVVNERTGALTSTLNSLGISVTDGTESSSVREEIPLTTAPMDHFYAWINSNTTKTMFFTRVKEDRIGRIFLGANCDIQKFLGIFDEHEFDSPYRPFVNPLTGEYLDIYKAALDQDEFKLEFTSLNHELAVTNDAQQADGIL
ncbi:DUF2971 domain-containing protein [Photobacterium rosenbergii]|uniref:DUF2971 domain-containing protein n=1 Tax=Photobacterium rosenbergii TaxID=294936 RepID=UPI001C9A1223|nr:DUF2971 domain-containing protein [Photobacterium rosenbergii]MBY5945608.1 DUF2971 domain-containing protein [Photobacterium rosenbergii]